MIKSSAFKTIVKLVISAGLLFFLFKKISLESIVDVLRTMDPRVLAGAVTVFFVSNLVGSWQWHLLLRSSGLRLSFLQSFRVYFVGLFFNNFLPANIGGDVVKVYDVSRGGNSVYQVIGVTVLDRLIGIFALCVLAFGSVVYLMQTTALESLGTYLIIFLCFLLPPMAFYFVEPLGRLLRRIVGSMRSLSMDKRGTSILDVMGEFKKRRGFVSRVVVLAVFVQSLRVLTHVLVGMALGVHLSATVLALFFVFIPLLSLAMIPPITINGLGIREGLGVLLFSQAGIARADAFTLEFLTYLISVAVSLLGLVFFLARRPAGVSAKGPSEHDLAVDRDP